MNGGEGNFFFLDTNILIYSQAIGEPHKQPIAGAIVEEALATRRGFISTQVVQEFLHVATRRAAPLFTTEETMAYLSQVLWPLCQHFPSPGFYERALQVRGEMGASFYDALIVTAALQLGCRRLLSEDMQHGRVIQGLRIVNPFLPEGA